MDRVSLSLDFEDLEPEVHHSARDQRRHDPEVRGCFDRDQNCPWCQLVGTFHLDRLGMVSPSLGWRRPSGCQETILFRVSTRTRKSVALLEPVWILVEANPTPEMGQALDSLFHIPNRRVHQ
jgi:hypothetical protein